MSEKDLYLIAEVAGYSPQIGRLVSMLNYTRSTTLTAVSGLGVYELDFILDASTNSIGALLSHIAAAEIGYQAATFHSRELSDEERQEWGAALELGDRARGEIRGRELQAYLSKLERVRARTLIELGSRDDAWLDQETTFGIGQRINNYFKWFHVVTHEVHHRGQIRWLRNRLP